MTAPVAIALLGVLTSIAIAVACVAILCARAARTALRASEARHRERAELDRKIEAGSGVAGDVAHDGGRDAALAKTRLTAPVLVVDRRPLIRSFRMNLARIVSST